MAKSVNINDRGSLVASRIRATKKLSAARKAVVRLKALVTRRNKQITALPKASQAAQAAKFLVARAGRHEDAGRPNRAAWLDEWAKRIGAWMIGQPWCGLAVWIACAEVGLTLDKRTVSTVYIRDAARAGTGGFKAWHPASAAPKVGWVAVYGTASTGPVHTGMYVGGGKMAEGNTSPGSGGSQNNGGGLYLRNLSERRSWLLGWAEPAFKN